MSDTSPSIPPAAPAPPTPPPPAPSGLVRRRGPFAPLTRRILAINVLTLGILVAGVLYLDEYRESLINAELVALQSQGRLFSVAIGEGAVGIDLNGLPRLMPKRARLMTWRMVRSATPRVRLFDLDGNLVSDSRWLPGTGDMVRVLKLPSLDAQSEGEGLEKWANKIFRYIDAWIFSSYELPVYQEKANATALDFGEVEAALYGESASVLRDNGRGGMIMSVALPVQRYKQVVGALMISQGGEEIVATLSSVRYDILKVFAIALGVTVLLSIYLAGTIARPIHLLSEAAERVRRHHDRHMGIPDFSSRRDEVGDLSVSLRDMTNALWARMDAIEGFAADVAHEIKNPLTSLRSAVETVVNLKDVKKQQKLLAIILEDVQRIDRLISDISDASRLDAELSRADRELVDVGKILVTLGDFHNEITGAEAGVGGAPQLVVNIAGNGDLFIYGMEGRLVQVFRNLIANAVSFSPPGGVITCTASPDDAAHRAVRITVEDQGPGIPENREEEIFERFYRERPEGEKFGTHSGLGLSISRQIVEAHGGTLRAENIYGPSGPSAGPVGARFTLLLPSEALGGNPGNLTSPLDLVD